MKPEDYRIVVSSGPTREWIDPVRFISNPSSGRTGWEIARAAVGQFQEVVYIAGPGDSRYSTVENARNINVDTTEEMRVAVTENIGDHTLLIMSAAPADFRVEDINDSKIKKLENSENRQTIHMVPTVDILKSIAGHTYRGFVRIGFAAETGNLEQYARSKIQSKSLDYICANIVYRSDRGFGDNENRLFVYGKDGSLQELGPAPKDRLAQDLLMYLERAIFADRVNEYT